MSVRWWQLSASPQRCWEAKSSLNIIFCSRMPALSPAAGRRSPVSECPRRPQPCRLAASPCKRSALGTGLFFWPQEQRSCSAPFPLVLLLLGGWEGKRWRGAELAFPGLCN